MDMLLRYFVCGTLQLCQRSFASMCTFTCRTKVAVCALLVKIRSLVRVISLRREEIDFEEDRFDKSSSDAKLLKHRKNLERTTRTVQGTRNFDFSLHAHAVHSNTITAGDKSTALPEGMHI